MPYQNALQNFKKENVRVFQNHAQKTLKDAINSKNIAIFRSAVDAAYRDAARTFTGIGSHAEEKEKALANFAEAVQSYFTASADNMDFDEKHNSWCEQLIKKFKPYEITYGQAQKIVNMTFKYLYCLDDANTLFNDYFKQCHVALDSFTLAWIWKCCEADKTFTKFAEWSNLTKTGEPKAKRTKAKAGYLDVVELYRTHSAITTKYSGCSPFQAEFIFWPEIQKELAAESFLIQLEDADKKRAKEIKAMSLKDKWKTILDKIQKIT